MGKINEYQRKQLVSSAVGVAPPDKSGEIIGGAVTKLGAALVTKAQKMDEYDTLQANTAVMQFGLAFQKLGAQEQRRMAANPGGYPDKIMEDGTTLLTSYADSIEDEGVRKKFLTAGNTILKAGVFEANKWAVAKKADNARIASENAIRLGTNAAGSTLTIAELTQSVDTVMTMAKDEIPDDVLSEADKKTQIDKEMPGVLDSHFSNRVMNDARQLIVDLKANKYADVPYYTNEMKNKYIKQAETYIRQEKTRIKTAQTLNYAEAGEAFLADQLTFSMIDALATAPEKEDGISPSQALLLKKGLVLQAESRASDLSENNASAEKYIKLVKEVVDNRVERAEVLNQVIEAFSMGIASREESQFFSQTLKGIETLKGDKMAQEWKKGAEIISEKAQDIWGSMTSEAVYLRNFITGMATGVTPNAVAQGVLRQMEKDKVIEDNPNLAASEEPVEDAYKIQAVDILKANGYPVDKANIEALIGQLKEADNRAEEE